MENSINQFYLLCIFMISGLIIGTLFDLFRILRKSFKTPDIITYIEDFMFWILTGIFLLHIIFHFSLGEIRLYMFISLGIGLILYFLTISKYFVSLSVKIVNFMKKIIKEVLNIIILPFKIIFRVLRKIIFKPVTIITINLSKNFMKFLNVFVKKINIFTKNKKNVSEKKDFPV